MAPWQVHGKEPEGKLTCIWHEAHTLWVFIRVNYTQWGSLKAFPFSPLMNMYRWIPLNYPPGFSKQSTTSDAYNLVFSCLYLGLNGGGIHITIIPRNCTVFPTSTWFPARQHSAGSQPGGRAMLWESRGGEETWPWGSREACEPPGCPAGMEVPSCLGRCGVLGGDAQGGIAPLSAALRTLDSGCSQHLWRAESPACQGTLGTRGCWRGHSGWKQCRGQPSLGFPLSSGAPLWPCTQ